MNSIEHLEKLSDMHRRGELTDDEFEIAKRDLLGQRNSSNVSTAQHPYQSKSEINWLLGGVAVVVIIILLSVSGNSDDDKVSIADAVPAPPKAEVWVPYPKAVTTGAWSYDSIPDAMRGSTTYLAYTNAPEPLYFDFPYQGGSIARLTLRKDPKYGRDIYLTISKGQISLPYQDERLAVKFDDGAVQYFRATDADNGASDIVFFSDGNYSRFLNSLKKSKKVTIEVPFYDEGRRQIVFPVDNLKWAY